MEFDINKPELKIITLPQDIKDRSVGTFNNRYEVWYIIRGGEKYDIITGVRIPSYVDTSRPFVLVEDPYCLILQGNDMFQADDGRVFRVLRDGNI